jgi:hypothetical protein
MSYVGSKPSVNEEVIRYQARTTLATLAYEISGARKLNNPETRKKIKQAKMVRLFLKALDYKEYLTREQREKIWYALIDVADINDFPLSPILEERERPNILVGIQGPQGVAGTGTGTGTNFVNADVDTGTEDVDTFSSSLADGAIWYYTITNGTARRTGFIMATWDASAADQGPQMDGPDLGGSTADVTVSVDLSAGTIRLRATTLSDNWTVRGTRYLIYG